MSETFTAPTPPVGVIESLTQGFEAVAGRLLLVFLPLLVDVAIWLGPRVSFEPLVTSWKNTSYRDFVSSTGTPTTGVTPEMEEMWRATVDLIAASLGGETDHYFPFIPFLMIPMLPDSGIPYMPLIGVPSLLATPDPGASQMPMVGAPSLLATREARPLPFNYTPPIVKIDSLAGFIGLRLFGSFVALLLGSLYVTLIGWQIRDERPGSNRLLLRVPLLVIQFFIFGIAAPLVLWFVLLPFFILQIGLTPMAAGLNGFNPGFLAGAVGRVVVLWVSMFIIFTIHSMLLHDRHLLGAVWDSVRVVQWNMTPTLFLFLLILTLNWGLMFVWTLPDTGSWITLLAIAGHAFVSTGLIAATYAFYKDRYRYWKEMREVLLAELARRQAEQESGVNKPS